MDSNLEAFSCVSSDANLGILVVQLDTFIKYMNRVFLSY